MSRIPVLRKRCVFHVGDPTAPPSRADSSYEGPGLSVSEHPEEWSQIARLGGYETHALRRLDGKPGVFVDMLRGRSRRRGQTGLVLPGKRPSWRETLENYAVNEGLLVPAKRYVARWYDEELDQTVDMLFTDLAEAQKEADLDGDREGAVLERAVLVATDELRKLHWGHRFSGQLDDSLAADIAVLYLLSLDEAYDGAWWNEDLAPEIYSAPRGVIFESKLAEWDIERGGEC